VSEFAIETTVGLRSGLSMLMTQLAIEEVKVALGLLKRRPVLRVQICGVLMIYKAMSTHTLLASSFPHEPFAGATFPF
jgi:hypothetical protein